MIVYYTKASLMRGFFMDPLYLLAPCIWIMWGLICNFAV